MFSMGHLCQNFFALLVALFVSLISFCSRAVSLLKQIKNQGADALAMKRQLVKGIALNPNVLLSIEKQLQKYMNV